MSNRREKYKQQLAAEREAKAKAERVGKSPRRLTKRARIVCSEPELRFCARYIQDGSATEAVRAGWPDNKNPSRYASKVLARRHVQDELTRLREKLRRKLDITPERVLREIAEIAFGKLGKFIRVGDDGKPTWDFTGATPDELAIVGELSVDEYVEGRGKNSQRVRKFKISERDRLKALELLGKNLALWTDNTKLEVSVSLVDRIQAGRNRIRQVEPPTIDLSEAPNE